MNIKQAKQEIIDTVQAYLLKNEYDEYVIPRVHQRPVLDDKTANAGSANYTKYARDVNSWGHPGTG